MAISLKLKFKDADARTISNTFNYAKATAAPADVKALMEKMIANKAIYSTEPVAIVGASFMETTETPITLP